jgi:hypothetical protein
MIRFEPRLHINGEAAGQIENMLMPLFESPTVMMTEGYPFPLAAENADNGVRVRAATGEEVTAFLTLGIAAHPDDFVWPGDPAMPTGQEIEAFCSVKAMTLLHQILLRLRANDYEVVQTKSAKTCQNSCTGYVRIWRVELQQAV